MISILFHKVTQAEKEQISKDTKKLLDKFSNKLEKIKTKEAHFLVGNGTRKEYNPWNVNPEFRDLMLLNAPFVEGDLIMAEKGAWKND